MRDDVATENIEAKIKNFFIKLLKDSNIDGDNIAMDADLFAEYGLESVKAIRLISDVEVEFEIDLEEDEIRNICTLNQLIKLTKTKIETLQLSPS